MLAASLGSFVIAIYALSYFKDVIVGIHGRTRLTEFSFFLLSPDVLISMLHDGRVVVRWAQTMPLPYVRS